MTSGSMQWNHQPVESVMYSAKSELPSDRIPRHSLHTRDTYETESRSTSSSGTHKVLTSYALPDSRRSYDKSLPFIPHTSSSVSGEEQDAIEEAADVLEAIHHPHNRHHGQFYTRPQQYFQFSQDSDYAGQYSGQFGSSSSTSLPLSQSTSHSGYRSYQTGPYQSGIYKPNSPGSSSDNASLSSSVRQRLESGPASEASLSSINLSQSTSSSRNGYVYRLPRPSLSSSNPGSATSLLPSHRHYVHKKNSYIQHSLPKKGFHSPDEYDEQQRAEYMSEKMSKSRYPKKHSDDKSERDSFSMKLEMVMNMMSALSSSSQSDGDAVKLMVALSQSSETCSVLRQPMFMSLLIKILHSNDKAPKEQAEIKGKALVAIHNIVESNSNTKQRRSERSVLSALNKIRSHCNLIFDFIYSFNHQEPIANAELENIQKSCNALTGVVRRLLKYSSDKQFHRPAILDLGGLQTMADVLICDRHLPKTQDRKLVGHNSEVLAITITVLINLTYGDVNNKVVLCNIPSFLDALMGQISLFNEQVMSKGAQVLRNLSCKATPEIKDFLFKCNAVVVLMEAVDCANAETTIQHITSALWNLSAHSLDNRYKVCQAKNGIEILVGLLSYNSPSGSNAVIENVGGVLRNLSNVISQEGKYRKKFREAGGLAKLVQHLKSRNKVVLANATGILWNLSARCPDNQKMLWDLGCIPLLDVLQTSPQRNISENARGALRNLLAFGQSKGWTSRVDHHQIYSKSATMLPSCTESFNISDQSGRSSAPFISNHDNVKSSNSLIQLRNSSDRVYAMPIKISADSKYSAPRIHGINGYPGKDHFTPKFSRVASAPQPNDEWMNYRPGGKQGSSPETDEKNLLYHSSSQVRPSSHKKQSKGASQSMKLASGHNYSYSQSESCDSEFQSISGTSFGASYGLSPQLPTEDGVMQEGGNEISYVELDIEIDDQLDDEAVSHYRHPSEAESETSESLSIADQFLRDRESMRKIIYNPPSNTSPSKSSPCLHHHKTMISELSRSLGTSGLALDGTAPTQDGLEPISESSDIIFTTPRSHSNSSRSHSNSISSVGQEMSTDI